MCFTLNNVHFYVHLFLFSSSSVKTTSSESSSSLFEELNQVQVKEKEANDDQKAKDEKTEEKEEDVDDDTGSLDWNLRNTDSLFSELSELSREYVESVDQGASVRGTLCTVCVRMRTFKIKRKEENVRTFKLNRQKDFIVTVLFCNWASYCSSDLLVTYYTMF